MRSFRDSSQVRGLVSGILLLLLLSGMLLHHVDARAEDAGAVIIANNTIPAISISKTDIQNIFLGKKTKLEGTPVTCVILQSGDVHEQFLKAFLSRTPDQYTKYWKKMVFTGKGKSPKAFETEEEMLAYVEATEGGIGYVSTSTAVQKAVIRLNPFICRLRNGLRPFCFYSKLMVS